MNQAADLEELHERFLPRFRAAGARDPHRHEDGALAAPVLERYLVNRKLTAAAAAVAGVRVLFVWQPTVQYGYDLKRHHLRTPEAPNPLPRYGYALFAERLKQQPLGPDFVWLADLQGAPDPVFVDNVHYAAGFCRLLAQGWRQRWSNAACFRQRRTAERRIARRVCRCLGMK